MWKPEPSIFDLRHLISEAGLSKERLLSLYAKMCLIRYFEEGIASKYYEGKISAFNMASGPIRGEMHLAVGQEAVAVGICSLLEEKDVVVSTHRPHHHALAKGVDPKKLAAEIFGKVTGLCRGKGGHMHLFDKDKRFSCSGIVGASFPQAAGAAFAFKYLNQNNVAVAFAGEGATNQGTFAETLNIASLFQLPLIIVIEDNMYADSTPKSFALSEVLDLRTLVPLDTNTIISSAKKTGRVLIVDEDYQSYGVTGEIAFRIQEGALGDLKAPVKRLTVPDVPIPFSEPLEKAANLA